MSGDKGVAAFRFCAVCLSFGVLVSSFIREKSFSEGIPVLSVGVLVSSSIREKSPSVGIPVRVSTPAVLCFPTDRQTDRHRSNDGVCQHRLSCAAVGAMMVCFMLCICRLRLFCAFRQTDRQTDRHRSNDGVCQHRLSCAAVGAMVCFMLCNGCVSAWEPADELHAECAAT
jgi:hypothetical protein